MNRMNVGRWVVAAILVGCPVALHWSRNRWNEPVRSIDDVAGWTKLEAGESIFHRMGPGNELNSKFVSPDGHSEAIFRPDPAGGEPTLVTDPVNIGTYNVFGPRLLFGIPHGIFDVVPYFLLGNTPGDMFNLARFRVLLERQ